MSKYLQKIATRNNFIFLLILVLLFLLYGYIRTFYPIFNAVTRRAIPCILISGFVFSYIYRLNRQYLISWLLFSAYYASASVCSYLTDFDTGISSYADVTMSIAICSVIFSFLAIIKILLDRFFKGLLLKVRNILLFVITFISLFIPHSIWSAYFIAQDPVTVDLVKALFQTNFSETIEYIKVHFSGWITSVIFISIITFCLFFSLLKLKSSNSSSNKVLIAFSVFALIYISAHTIPQLDNQVILAINGNSDVQKEFSDYRNNTETRTKAISSLNFDKEKLSAHKGTYLLIIGESETRDNMQVYGYSRNTTPFMNSLLENNSSKAIKFTNAYSNYIMTLPTLTFALTQQNQYNNIELKNAFSIIELAKHCGYDTYWLSSQSRRVLYDNPVIQISNSSQNKVFLDDLHGFTQKYGKSDVYDAELANELPVDELNQSDASFVVLHMNGSHVAYKDRVPENERHFTGSDPLIDQYDDTVLYTDKVIESIYNKVKTIPNFMGIIYLSDHGENQNFGHDPFHFTFHMVRIPLFFIPSEKFINNCQETYSALYENKDKIWTNDLLFELVMNVLGINAPDLFIEKFDLSSSSYGLTKEEAKSMHGNLSLATDPGLK